MAFCVESPSVSTGGEPKVKTRKMLSRAKEAEAKVRMACECRMDYL